MKNFLIKLQQKQSFTDIELKEVFENIIDKKYSDLEIASFLYGLSVKGETSDEIVAIVKLLRKRAKKFNASQDVIDVCGTGGDGLNSLNISTAVAIVVAACGVKVAKHGNRAVSSKSGSSDVLTELGVNIDAKGSAMENSLQENNLAFLFAPLYHESLASIAPIRKELGVRTIFNLIGPLLNPAMTKRQIIGVSQKNMLDEYADAVLKLDYEKVLILNSEEGMDEASISGLTNVIEIEGGKKKEFQINPKDFCLNIYDISEIKGGDAKYNAKEMIKIFQGETNAYSEITALNAGLALYVSGKYDIINDAIQIAKDALKEKKAMVILNKLKEIL